jgi:hypothetical protein
VKTDIARRETTEVTVGVTATEAVTVTDTATEKEVAGATGTDMAALVAAEMMTTEVDQVATTAVMTVEGVTTILVLLVGIGMMGHLEEVVEEEEAVVVVAVAVVEREWAHLNAGLLPPKVQCRSLRGNAKLLGGTSMLPGMNNTVPCRQSRLDCSICPEPTARKFLPFWVLQDSLHQCPFKPSVWA